MPILNIAEKENPHKINQKPIREKQDIYIPHIVDQNISRRNGMVYLLCGSGGSGKSSLMLNAFKDYDRYKEVFSNIWYFCPIVSFLSVAKHPFEHHDKVYHEFTVEKLDEIYKKLIQLKKGEDSDNESDSDSDEEKEIKYNIIIIDDFADVYKDKEMSKYLNKFIIKTRHLLCGVIFTAQGYTYLPKILRKQLTYITMFKPNNMDETEFIFKETLNMKKDDSLILYNYVFDKPYMHLDIDTKENILYKNFNRLMITYGKN